MAMTNQEILRIAMNQSAVDLGAEALDFTKSENVIVFFIILRSNILEEIFNFLTLRFFYVCVKLFALIIPAKLCLILAF